MREKQIKMVKLSEIRPGEYFRVSGGLTQCLCVSASTRCDVDRRSYVILGDDEILATGDVFAVDEMGRWACRPAPAGSRRRSSVFAVDEMGRWAWDVYRTDRHGNAIEFEPQRWLFCDLHEGDCFTIARDPDAYYCVVSEDTGECARVVLATGEVQTQSGRFVISLFERVQPITVSLTATPKESV